MKTAPRPKLASQPAVENRVRNPFAEGENSHHSASTLLGPLSRWQVLPLDLLEQNQLQPELAQSQPPIQQTGTSLTIVQPMSQSAEPRHSALTRSDLQPPLPPGTTGRDLSSTRAPLPIPDVAQQTATPIRSAFLSLDESVPTRDVPKPERNQIQQPDLVPPTIPSTRIASVLDAPDPLQFVTEPNPTPVWLPLTPGQRHAQPVKQADFDALSEGVNDASSDEPPTNSGSVLATETESVLISEFSDSADGWLAKAQDLARASQTLDNLAEIAKLCHRVLDATATPEQQAAATRLAAWAHNRRGELLLEAGQSEAGLAELQDSIACDPENALAIHNRAVTLAQQNDFEAALIDFNRVIELNPGLSVALRNRAELFAAQGKTEEAVADYTRAIDAAPEDAELYRARAHSLQQLRQFEQALADLDRAVELSPDDAQSYTQRANLLADRGEYQRALDEFKRSLTIDAELAETHRGRAWLRATCPDDQHRDAFEALTAAHAAIEHSPEGDYQALDALAAAQANAGEFDKAITSIQRAIEVAPVEAATAMQARLSLYQQRKPFRATVPQ